MEAGSMGPEEAMERSTDWMDQARSEMRYGCWKRGD